MAKRERVEERQTKTMREERQLDDEERRDGQTQRERERESLKLNKKYMFFNVVMISASLQVARLCIIKNFC